MESVKDYVTRFLEYIKNDFKMRTVAITVPSTIGSILYAILTGFAAILSRSLWLGIMTAFYVITILMRLFVLGRAGLSLFLGNKKVSPAVNYRRFSRMLLVFDGLLGLTILFFHFRGIHKDYPGYTIYLTALYVFVKGYLAIINIVKAHKNRSFTTISLRQINAIKAIVSVLILQAALLSRFGDPYSDFTRNFNSASGAGAFLIILVMSIDDYIAYKKGRL
ncbi:MAG: hypothetical protein IJ757_04225 [Clostridiales bacterium]|nr:hypothetical protein [Clostridiales bacterium]